ncbi:9666_t:CDS:2, partial [Dentiscutata heterogama]
HNHQIVKHEDYQHLTEQEFIKNTISDRNNCLAICQCKCCSQCILAHYDDNSGPYEYLIQQNKNVQNKTEKNQYKDHILKAAKECIDEIIKNNLLKEEAIIKLLQRKKDAIQRCWCPVVFYLYRLEESEKT